MNIEFSIYVEILVIVVQMELVLLLLFSGNIYSLLELYFFV